MDDRPYMSWDEDAGRLLVCLPHQCSEWTIGGIEEVRAMIEALRALLPEFARADAYRHAHSCASCGVVVYKAAAVCRRHECSAWGRGWVCGEHTTGHNTKSYDEGAHGEIHDTSRHDGWEDRG